MAGYSYEDLVGLAGKKAKEAEEFADAGPKPPEMGTEGNRRLIGWLINRLAHGVSNPEQTGARAVGALMPKNEEEIMEKGMSFAPAPMIPAYKTSVHLPGYHYGGSDALSVGLFESENKMDLFKFVKEVVENADKYGYSKVHASPLPTNWQGGRPMSKLFSAAAGKPGQHVDEVSVAQLKELLENKETRKGFFESLKGVRKDKPQQTIGFNFASTIEPRSLTKQLERKYGAGSRRRSAADDMAEMQGQPMSTEELLAELERIRGGGSQSTTSGRAYGNRSADFDLPNEMESARWALRERGIDIPDNEDLLRMLGRSPQAPYDMVGTRDPRTVRPGMENWEPEYTENVIGHGAPGRSFRAADDTSTQLAAEQTQNIRTGAPTWVQEADRNPFYFADFLDTAARHQRRRPEDFNIALDRVREYAASRGMEPEMALAHINSQVGLTVRATNTLRRALQEQPAASTTLRPRYSEQLQQAVDILSHRAGENRQQVSEALSRYGGGEAQATNPHRSRYGGGEEALAQVKELAAQIPPDNPALQYYHELVANPRFAEWANSPNRINRISEALRLAGPEVGLQRADILNMARMIHDESYNSAADYLRNILRRGF